MLAVDRISFDIKPGETRGARRRVRVGQVGLGALDPASSCPIRRPTIPRARSCSRARTCSRASEDEMRQVRGDDITMVFQEPMTSLNPLHTIERQVGEILRLHRGVSERAARARILELLDHVGIRDAESRARRLSAPAFGRTAPARDDRHGARQRARPVHRRRADDRARRHRAGADPEAARRAEGPARHGDAVHHPRPRHRARRSPTGSA